MDASWTGDFFFLSQFLTSFDDFSKWGTKRLWKNHQKRPKVWWEKGLRVYLFQFLYKPFFGLWVHYRWVPTYNSATIKPWYILCFFNYFLGLPNPSKYPICVETASQSWKKSLWFAFKFISKVFRSRNATLKITNQLNNQMMIFRFTNRYDYC